MAFLCSVYSVAHMLLVKRHRKITKTDLSINLWRTPSQQRISFWYSPIFPAPAAQTAWKSRTMCRRRRIVFRVLLRMGIDSGAALCYTVVRKRCSMAAVRGALTPDGWLHLFFFCHSDKIIEQLFAVGFVPLSASFAVCVSVSSRCAVSLPNIQNPTSPTAYCFPLSYIEWRLTAVLLCATLSAAEPFP